MFATMLTEMIDDILNRTAPTILMVDLDAMTSKFKIWRAKLNFNAGEPNVSYADFSVLRCFMLNERERHKTAYCQPLFFGARISLKAESAKPTSMARPDGDTLKTPYSAPW